MIRDTVRTTQEAFPDVNQVSFDYGFYTPDNLTLLEGILDCAVLPKKRYTRGRDQVRESAPPFVTMRTKHPGIESCINKLEHCGLDWVRAHGADGFKKMVGVAIVAANIHRIEPLASPVLPSESG